MMSVNSIYFEWKVCGNSYDQKSQQNRNFDRKLEPKEPFVKYLGNEEGQNYFLDGLYKNLNVNAIL